MLSDEGQDEEKRINKKTKMKFLTIF